MARAVKVVVDRAAVRALLRSAPIQHDLERRARRIAATAGPGHRIETSAGANRARVAVITDSDEAKVAESRNRSLTRSIDAGRGR